MLSLHEWRHLRAHGAAGQGRGENEEEGEVFHRKCWIIAS